MLKDIKDNYVKIRPVHDKWYAVHLFTDKVLYNPYTGYTHKLLSKYSLARVKEALKKLIGE